MNNLFILLGLVVVLASAASLPTTSTPVLETIVANVCQKVSSAKPAKVKVYYEEVLKTLDANQTIAKNFPKTLAYLNNSTNENEFLAGGQECVQFFAGLKAPLLADYKARGISPENAAQRVVKYLQNVIARIKAAIQADQN